MLDSSTHFTDINPQIGWTFLPWGVAENGLTICSVLFQVRRHQNNLVPSQLELDLELAQSGILHQFKALLITLVRRESINLYVLCSTQFRHISL